MDKIYLWIGCIQNEEIYWEYFSETNGKPKFCIETGLDWLDQDFMGYYYSSDNYDIKAAIENTPESGLFQEMYDLCLQKGVRRANSMFYYTGDEITVDASKNYNGLVFIGVFNWV